MSAQDCQRRWSSRRATPMRSRRREIGIVSLYFLAVTVAGAAGAGRAEAADLKIEQQINPVDCGSGTPAQVCTNATTSDTPITGASTVGVAPMANPVDGQALGVVVDGEQDTVLADPQLIAFSPMQFFHLVTTRLFGQSGVHGLDQPSALQAFEEFGVRQGATRGAERPVQGTRIVTVFGPAEQLLVVREGQDHGFGMAMLINDEAIRLHSSGHRSLLLLTRSLA